MQQAYPVAKASVIASIEMSVRVHFCTSASSDQSSGKNGRWSPLPGSALSLECGILSSCHMGCDVLITSSLSSVLHLWPW